MLTDLVDREYQEWLVFNNAVTIDVLHLAILLEGNVTDVFEEKAGME